MDVLPASLALIATLLYLSASAYVARAIARQQSPERGPLIGLLSTALLLHGIVMHEVLIQPGGLFFGLATIAVLHGWLLALLALLVNVYRPVQGIFLIAMPLAAIELGLGVLGHEPNARSTAFTAMMQGHILLSLLAYSVLSIAALQALLVFAQDRALRRHRRGILMALPSLQTMENMLFELIGIGMVLLTLAIGTGFFELNNLFAQHVAHKTVLSLMAWAVFAGLLAGRFWRGWRGRTAVKFTLAGFALLLLGFVGSQAVIELLLNPSAP
ncbi:cytochrome C assembly family protein [Perlucidibaca aquatica]|uniref:cytochrome C assembly family protein n=1 Tax=Perlucidibaca aquatica TaxID=1852776 RepID=UPI00083B3099|nr:cytochrome c biogenesis protein CcsA [Perlucidibaca aquatica]